MKDLFGHPETIRGGIGSHHSATDGTDEWLTPPHILQAVKAPFDLDPCSPIRRPWDTAAKHYTAADNGLMRPWSGRVWLNPPYGRSIDGWLRRMAQHRSGIALIFARTETEAWQQWVWPKASGILFLAGRLTFCLPSGKPAPGNSGAPSALVAYSDYDRDVLFDSNLPGARVPGPILIR